MGIPFIGVVPQANISFSLSLSLFFAMLCYAMLCDALFCFALSLLSFSSLPPFLSPLLFPTFSQSELMICSQLRGEAIDNEIFNNIFIIVDLFRIEVHTASHSLHGFVKRD